MLPAAAGPPPHTPAAPSPAGAPRGPPGWVPAAGRGPAASGAGSDEVCLEARGWGLRGQPVAVPKANTHRGPEARGPPAPPGAVAAAVALGPRGGTAPRTRHRRPGPTPPASVEDAAPSCAAASAAGRLSVTPTSQKGGRHAHLLSGVFQIRCQESAADGPGHAARAVPTAPTANVGQHAVCATSHAKTGVIFTRYL